MVYLFSIEGKKGLISCNNMLSVIYRRQDVTPGRFHSSHHFDNYVNCRIFCNFFYISCYHVSGYPCRQRFSRVFAKYFFDLNRNSQPPFDQFSVPSEYVNHTRSNRAETYETYANLILHYLHNTFFIPCTACLMRCSFSTSANLT